MLLTSPYSSDIYSPAYVILRLWHCMHWDGLPKEFRIPDLAAHWWIEACQNREGTHDGLIIVCASDKNLKGKGENEIWAVLFFFLMEPQTF